MPTISPRWALRQTSFSRPLQLTPSTRRISSPGAPPRGGKASEKVRPIIIRTSSGRSIAETGWVPITLPSLNTVTRSAI